MARACLFHSKMRFCFHFKYFLSSSVVSTYTILCTLLLMYILWFVTKGFVDISLTAWFIQISPNTVCNFTNKSLKAIFSKWGFSSPRVVFLSFSSTHIHHSLHISSYIYSMVRDRRICWYIIHSLIFTTFYAQKWRKFHFFSMLTVFSDLWDDGKTYPQSLLSRTIVVLCEHNAKIILNLALSNVQETDANSRVVKKAKRYKTKAFCIHIHYPGWHEKSYSCLKATHLHPCIVVVHSAHGALSKCFSRNRLIVWSAL